MALVASGLSSLEITERLSITDEILDEHFERIARKLGTRNGLWGVPQNVAAPAVGEDTLAPAERILCRLLFNGLTTLQAAARMRISVAEVHTHRFRAMQKLRIQNFELEEPDLA